MYKKTENGKDIELQEVGPRFEMKSEYEHNCISSEIEKKIMHFLEQTLC